MGQQTTTICCDHCGAPLKGTGKRTVVTCEFCGREQSLREDDPEDDEESDEDAPDSESWDEADDDDEEASDAEEDEGPLDVDECIALLQQHVEENEDDYDAEEMVIELDEENTDDERVYLYLKDADGDVLDYFFVDREDGTLEVYDYEGEQWDEV